MQSKRVLVTGGAGLIGSDIVDKLMKDETAEVIVFDNFCRGRRENVRGAFEDDAVRIVEGEFRGRPHAAELMQSTDAFFRQAARRNTWCAEGPSSAWMFWRGASLARGISPSLWLTPEWCGEA